MKQVLIRVEGKRSYWHFVSFQFLARAEKRGLIAVPEVFADRGYLPDGRLAPRGSTGALLHNQAEICRRILELAATGTVQVVDGTATRLFAPGATVTFSICIHGDNENAPEIAAGLKQTLQSGGFAVGCLPAH